MQAQEVQKITKEYKKTVSDALKALGKKHMALICHGVSFPSREGENTGFGTYNSDAAKDLISFLGDMFNVIQLSTTEKQNPRTLLRMREPCFHKIPCLWIYTV